MRLPVHILLLVVVLSCTLHAQHYFVRNELDPGNGSSVAYMVNNYISPELQLAAGIVRRDWGNAVYILACHYSGYDRFGARSMELIIDGEKIILDTIINTQRRRNYEIVGFEVTRDILRKLGHAERVRLHVRGNWSIEREIDQVVIKRFGEFYFQHMR